MHHGKTSWLLQVPPPHPPFPSLLALLRKHGPALNIRVVARRVRIPSNAASSVVFMSTFNTRAHRAPMPSGSSSSSSSECGFPPRLALPVTSSSSHAERVLCSKSSRDEGCGLPKPASPSSNNGLGQCISSTAQSGRPRASGQGVSVKQGQSLQTARNLRRRQARRYYNLTHLPVSLNQMTAIRSSLKRSHGFRLSQ